jgi:cellulose synthase (UDP-forming)
LYQAFKESEDAPDKINARILKPARLLHIDYVYDYHAMIYNEKNGWHYGQTHENYSFEWSLVKCDEHGNYLAVKEIGTKPVLSLKIPENHEYFKLHLTVSDGFSVTSIITSLNTPLVLAPN